MSRQCWGLLESHLGINKVWFEGWFGVNGGYFGYILWIDGDLKCSLEVNGFRHDCRWFGETTCG